MDRLLAAPFLELVLRESPVGEHATNGVAESGMREVKRQTQTLEFALEAHVGKIVKSHSILRWIPLMASDAISFFRIGRDGFTAEMRRSGRAWKKFVAEFGESVYCRRAVARAVAKCNVTRAVQGSESWAPRTNRQQSHHDDRWSLESCRVSKDEC